MFMSEHEKFEQVGRLAEEYSKLKGELNHIVEKLGQASRAAVFIGQNFAQIAVHDGLLASSAPALAHTRPPIDIQAMLSSHEMAVMIGDRDRINGELAQLSVRIKALAPHLLP